MPPANPKQKTPGPDQNPLGDPRAFRGRPSNLKELSKPEPRSAFLPSFHSSFGGFIVELAKIVIIALAIIVPIRTFILQPFYVKGASMEPNFRDNEYLIIDELSYRLHLPQRGDVVVLRNPALGEFLIKRLIGLPDERVMINDGAVSIVNTDHPEGVRLDERAYLGLNVLTFGNLDVTLGNDEYFVMGDNRSASLDSRSFGPIPRRDIIGRAAFRAWPVNRATGFSTPKIQLQSAGTP